MSKLRIGSLVVAVGVIIVAVVILTCFIGKNDDQNFQIKQAMNGEITIQDEGGYYGQLFNTIWTYPKIQKAYFSADVSGKEGDTEDDSVRVTFNDGGMAKISMFVCYKLPVDMKQRRELHRRFSGNAENIKGAIRSALINICKNTAPLMSASEHQSARKAEFAQYVEDQLRDGQYEMRRESSKFKDSADKDGKEITIFKTKIVLDDKLKPKIAQKSPLEEYGFKVIQFSVTGTDYDEQTRKQFAAKKDAFLKAELAKSIKEEEVQKRLQVIEAGLRKKAEMEATMNVEKIQAVIAAEKEKEVAEQQKLQAEIKANQLLAVSEIEKKQAAVKLEQAQLDADAKIVLAKAKQQEIELSGAIMEETRVLAEIEKETRIGVAKEFGTGFGNAKLPMIMNFGGSSGAAQAGSSGTLETMMKVMLLKMLPPENTGRFTPRNVSVKSPVAKK